MASGIHVLLSVQRIKTIHGNCRRISGKVMGDGGDNILVFSVRVASPVRDFFVDIQKGQQDGSDCDVVRQPAIFPVFQFCPIERKVVGGDVFILAACFYVEDLSEFLDGKGGVGYDCQFHMFTLVELFKIFRRIALIFGAVVADGFFRAFAAVREDIEGVDLPLPEKTGFYDVLFIDASFSDFECVDIVRL